MPARNELNAGRRDAEGGPCSQDGGREGRPQVVASERAFHVTGRTVQRNLDEASFQLIAINKAVPVERATRYQGVGERPTRHNQNYHLLIGDPRDDIRGIALVYIALYRAAFPEAEVAEGIDLLWNVHSRYLERPLCYHPRQIEGAELRIGITRTSMQNTEARENVRRRRLRRRFRRFRRFRR